MDLLSYLSNRVAIFLKEAPHGISGSSLKEEISCSNNLSSRYSTAASRIASAFLSGQLKCFKTARSSACRKQNM